jgi:hypothetical protein
VKLLRHSLFCLLLFSHGLFKLPRQHALGGDRLAFLLNCFFGGSCRIGFSLSGFEFSRRWQKSKEDRLKPILLKASPLEALDSGFFRA